MARISIEDARRLGIRVEGLPPAPRRREKATPARTNHKRGRIAAGDVRPEPELLVFLPVEPKTKHRPRTSLSKDEVLKAFHASRGNASAFSALLEKVKHRTYTPQETRDYEETVARLASAAMRSRAPFSHPVELDVVFVLSGEPCLWPVDGTDPDLDNLEKALCDALNKVVWTDDRLIVRKTSWMLCGDRPGIHLAVRPARVPDLDALLRTQVG